MLNALTEIFLAEYFTAECLAQPLFGDAQSLFDKLYEAFLLPEEGRAELFALVTSDEVRALKTKGDYARFRRVASFAEFTGAADGFTAEQKEVIFIKGEALKTIADMGLGTPANTPIAAYKHISELSNNGSLVALRLIGLLQCSGAELMGGSYRSGTKCLKMAAQWNSVEGLLLALYFDEATRSENINRLNTVTHGTPFHSLVELAEKKYSVKVTGYAPENKLLKKAFRARVIRPDVYAPQYARFIFSEVIDIKDKEQLLFADSKELVSETADLPLRLDDDMEIAESVDRIPALEGRTAELDKIIACAMSGDLRTEPSYRPLCVCSDSEYLRTQYAHVVASVYKDANIEYIDVAALTEYDFEPTKNHIFIRSCNEDMPNVYVLYFAGDIRPAVLDAVKNFLQTDKRRRFRLARPSVDIDLSPVLPVCFCDKQNAKTLKQFCDMVSVAPVGGEEKREILGHLIADLQARYSSVKIELEEDAMRTLAEFTIDKAESVLEKIIRFNRRRKTTIVITTEMLKDGVFGADVIPYGFGGRNEDK